MNREELLEKLNAIAKPANSWLKEAKARVENRDALRYSQDVALKILRELRVQKKSQADLAEALSVSPQQVNKWIKGSENFTFETIAKIDAALGIKLLQIHFDEPIKIVTQQIEQNQRRQQRSYTSKSKARNCRVVNFNDYNVPTKLKQIK